MMLDLQDLHGMVKVPQEGVLKVSGAHIRPQGKMRYELNLVVAGNREIAGESIDIRMNGIAPPRSICAGFLGHGGGKSASRSFGADALCGPWAGVGVAHMGEPAQCSRSAHTMGPG